MRGLLSETVNHKLSAEGIILWVPTLGAFSDRNESFGIPKTARVRFKLHAGEGGQHAWPRRFPLIFAKG
jgi:hypothetical protein